MKHRKNRSTEEVNYWQPATDVLSGLLFVILLIMALLLLYIGHNNFEYENNGSDNTNSTTSISQYNETQTTTYNEQEQNGGGTTEPSKSTEATESYTYGNDDIDKAAVLVKVIDADTNKTIKKEGLIFELYSNNSSISGLQILSTYYPKKIEYNQFQTKEDGTFYLPEKIPEGKYSLRNIEVSKEYQLADDVNFEITHTYDWNNPFIVEVPLSPVKNVIKIRCKDDQTEATVGNAVFDVYAKEDIKTLDGTVRFEKDDKVDTIVCDEDGFGKSKKLNLGKYYLRQVSAPKYYSTLEEDIDLEVNEKTIADTSATEIMCSKTTFKLTLIDKYTKEPIPNAVFNISDIGDMKTNSKGIIVVNKLNKNTTYDCTLKSLPDSYQSTIEPITFDVDGKGRISGKSTFSVDESAYIIRLKISVKDSLLDYYLNGESVTLYDSNNNVVANWDCDGSAKIIDNINIGTYKISVNNNSKNTVVSVKDGSEINEAVINIWTLTDTLLVVAGALTVLVILGIIILISRKRRKKGDNR
jgi:hypothetical protein